MSVADGQAVSAAITNPAFLKPDVDDFTVSRLGMQRAASPSGYFVQDIQRYINNVAQVIGLAYTANYTAEADGNGTTYGSTSTIISNGLPFKSAITQIANAFAIAGHAHTGAGNDGAQIALTSGVSGILPIANGGTNAQTALVNGKVIVSNSGSLIEGFALDSGSAALSTSTRFVTITFAASFSAQPVVTATVSNIVDGQNDSADLSATVVGFTIATGIYTQVMIRLTAAPDTANYTLNWLAKG